MRIVKLPPDTKKEEEDMKQSHAAWNTHKQRAWATVAPGHNMKVSGIPYSSTTPKCNTGWPDRA